MSRSDKKPTAPGPDSAQDRRKPAPQTPAAETPQDFVFDDWAMI